MHLHNKLHRFYDQICAIAILFQHQIRSRTNAVGSYDTFDNEGFAEVAISDLHAPTLDLLAPANTISYAVKKMLEMMIFDK